ncbi:hypothetical protein MUP59_00955 [Candidatus Bathyarchaeota archaeon]|nr:hypothetical protein [Candidatus Bathyarchaeota archaeon]
MKNAYCGCCNVEVEDWEKHEATITHRRNVSDRLRQMAKDEVNPKLKVLYSEMVRREFEIIEVKDIDLKLFCNTKGCSSKEDGCTMMRRDKNPQSYTCPNCGRSVVIAESTIKVRYR